MKLSNEQLDVCERVRLSNNKTIKITGDAGTGKSTIIAELANQFGPRCQVVTPTNKAAVVLRAKGVKAHTAYKIFFVPENVFVVNNFDTEIQSNLDNAQSYEQFKDAKTVLPKLIFTPCDRVLPDHCDEAYELPDGKLDYSEVIILDEASMAPAWMIRDLERMSDKLILVGDERQLAPVNDRRYPRGYFNSLPADYRLTEQFRQHENHLLQALELLKTESGQKKAVWGYIPQIENDQLVSFIKSHRPKILCYTNVVRHQFNVLSRLALGFSGYPKVGEPMIATGTIPGMLTESIPNGFEGVVVAVDSDECGFVVDFNGLKYRHEGSIYDNKKAPVDFAYAITAHKAQGSEYPVTLVVNQAGLVNYITDKVNADVEDKLSYDIVHATPNELNKAMEEFMLWKKIRLTGKEASRRWAYTVLTRGKQVFHTTVRGFDRG